MTKISYRKLIALTIALALGAIFTGSGSRPAAADSPPGCYQNGQKVDCSTSPGSNDIGGKPLDPSKYCYILAVGPVDNSSDSNWQQIACSDPSLTASTPSTSQATGLTPDCSAAANTTSGPAAGCTKAGSDPAAASATCDTNNCDLIAKYLNPAITLLAAIVGVVVVISIIMGGIQYSTSAGDPQKAAKAKGRIMNAVIALVAFALLYAFLQFIIPGGAFK